MDGFVYIPGDEPERPAPLGRYLPPIPEGVAAAFLRQHIGQEQGAWILDPLGASPTGRRDRRARLADAGGGQQPGHALPDRDGRPPALPGRAARGPVRTGGRPQGRRASGNPSPIPVYDHLQQVPAPGAGRGVRVGTRGQGAGGPHLSLCVWRRWRIPGQRSGPGAGRQLYRPGRPAPGARPGTGGRPGRSRPAARRGSPGMLPAARRLCARHHHQQAGRHAAQPGTPAPAACVGVGCLRRGRIALAVPIRPAAPQATGPAAALPGKERLAGAGAGCGTLAGKREPRGGDELARAAGGIRRSVPVRRPDARPGAAPEGPVHRRRGDRAAASQPGLLDALGAVGRLVVGTRGSRPVQVSAAPPAL